MLDAVIACTLKVCVTSQVCASLQGASQIVDTPLMRKRVPLAVAVILVLFPKPHDGRFTSDFNPRFLQIGVVIAWPAFGVALMESLTEWRTPIVEVGIGQGSKAA